MVFHLNKLLAPSYWISGSREGHEGENDAPRQAANEIERLRGEVEHWSGPVQQSWKKAWTEAQTIYDKSIKELEAENEKLLGVLKYIAKQELFEEMDEETREHANFEDAYEWLVQEARRALLDKING